MNEIQTNTWKEFKIYELCETQMVGKKIQVPTGASVSVKQLFEGDIPKVSVSGINNGIVGYYKSNDKNYRVYRNFISVSFLGTVFYQEGEAQLDMKVHCLKFTNVELNKYIAMFLVSVIRKTISLYDYADQISSTVLPNLTIKLPVDETGKPDFLYMETYIKNLESKVSSSLTNLKSAKKSAHSYKIDTTKWKRFHLYDDCLFDIDSGTKLDKVKMRTNNPTINFVGRANANNGITTCVDLIEDIPPYEAGNMTLSLGGEYLGSCFVQKKPFYTSQNVVVLIPKWNMPFGVKMFISCMVFKESRTYYKAFIDELNRHIKRDFSFYLPVKDDETPDWDYMENYIKDIFGKTINNPILG